MTYNQDFTNGYSRGMQDRREGTAIENWKLDGYPRGYIVGYEKAQNA